jgi:hypothetical protein
MGGDGLVEFDRQAASDLWNELSGFAKIELPRSGAVISYCTKYTIKGGEIDLSRNLSSYSSFFSFPAGAVRGESAEREKLDDLLKSNGWRAVEAEYAEGRRLNPRVDLR